MGRIVFYEDRNFTGRSYEWSNDCSDTSAFLSRCHSCRVEGGCWMVYDRNNYTGNQHFLRRGEYADCLGMWGVEQLAQVLPHDPHGRTFSSDVTYRGNYRMRVYDKENFMGQMTEAMDDCDSFTDRYHWSGGCMSCHVMDGHWLMYEQPHYRGKMWYFGPGEYRNFRDWGGMRFMSMRRIMDSWH